MKASSKALELIKQFEGLRLKAYLCPGGVWTIGYGHTAGVKPGMVISEAQAEEYLKADLISFERYLNGLGLALNQNQFDALISIAASTISRGVPIWTALLNALVTPLL